MLGENDTGLTPETAISKTLFICGETGAGKSTLAWYLTNEFKNINGITGSRQSLHSVTKATTVTKSVLRHEDSKRDTPVYYSFRIVDTVGFGADDVSENDIVSSTVKMAEKFYEIDYVILLIPLTRARDKFVQDWSKFHSKMKRLGCQDKNIQVYITHAFTYSAKLRSTCLTEVKAILAKIGMNVLVSYLDLPNVPDLNPQLLEFITPIVESSYISMISNITKPVAPFLPSSGGRRTTFSVNTSYPIQQQNRG